MRNSIESAESDIDAFPEWKSKASFKDLILVLGTRHSELRNAYDALLEENENLKMHRAASKQTISNNSRFASMSSSMIVPDDECSLHVNKLDVHKGVSFSATGAENGTSFVIKSKANLHQECDRLEALLARFQELSEAMPRLKSLGSRQSPKFHTIREITTSQDHLVLGLDEPPAMEQTCTMETEIEQTDKPTRDRRRFGIVWDGLDQENMRHSSMQMLAATVDCRKQVMDTASAFVIIAYVIFLGVEIEVLSRAIEGYQEHFYYVHMTFNSFFLVEILIRLWDDGLKGFFLGKEWRLNWLDLALVISSLTDVIFKGSSSGSSRILRSIRVVRIVRMVRFLRAIREIREFQKMVFAISSSMKTLVFSVIILFCILYFFAVIFAYGAMDARAADPNIIDLELYWGTFMVSIYSCFISISTGQSWYFVVAPLSEYSGLLTIAFVAFIALVIFGVMNAITSIFVESAIMSAQYYRELIVLDKEHEKEVAVTHMKQVFNQIDEDKSGEITAHEMEYFLSRGDLRSYLEALDISADDTRMLFRLLDTDSSGVIDVQEFCDGCMRLKGEARAFDVHILLFQTRHFLEKWSEFTGYVEDHFEIILDSMAPIGPMSKEIKAIKKRAIKATPSLTQVSKERTSKTLIGARESLETDLSHLDGNFTHELNDSFR